MRIAFLGLGTMGAPMAKNLLAAGHALTVWNRSPARAESLVAIGAARGSTPRHAVADAELVVTMLSDEHALEAILEGDDGVLAGLPRGAIFVEMSTLGRDAAMSAATRVVARGGRFVDAPVSGTRGPAIAGKLLVLAGGDAADVEAITPALSALGTVIHLGPLGSGAAMKLALNALGAQMLLGLASALGLAARMGVAPEAALDVIMKGPFASPLYQLKRPRLLAKDGGADPDFTIALWEKDQRLALEEAARHGYPMPQLEAVRALLQAAVAQGLGGADIGAIGKIFGVPRR